MKCEGINCRGDPLWSPAFRKDANMGKFRLACHLIQFRGEQHENPEKVLAEVAEAGWDGVEGLKIDSGDDLVAKANLARKNGLHLVNVGDRVRLIGFGSISRWAMMRQRCRRVVARCGGR